MEFSARASHKALSAFRRNANEKAPVPAATFLSLILRFSRGQLELTTYNLQRRPAGGETKRVCVVSGVQYSLLDLY